MIAIRPSRHLLELAVAAGVAVSARRVLFEVGQRGGDPQRRRQNGLKIQ